MAIQEIPQNREMSDQVDHAICLILKSFDENDISKSVGVSAMASLLCSILNGYQDRVNFDHVINQMCEMFNRTREEEEKYERIPNS